MTDEVVNPTAQTEAPKEVVQAIPVQESTPSTSSAIQEAVKPEVPPAPPAKTEEPKAKAKRGPKKGSKKPVKVKAAKRIPSDDVQLQRLIKRMVDKQLKIKGKAAVKVLKDALENV